MNFEIELKKTIKEKYGSVRAFSQVINTPYSTIDNIFKRGIMGVSIQVVLKICSELHIDVEKIQEDKLVLKKTTNYEQLNDAEYQLLTAYRNHPDMQPAINKMLDIEIYTQKNPSDTICDFDSAVDVTETISTHKINKD